MTSIKKQNRSRHYIERSPSPHPFAIFVTIFGNPFSLTTPVTSFLNDHLHNSIYLQVQTYAFG